MTPRTLRRKLQKKLKHKPYSKCHQCGGRMDSRLVEMHGLDMVPPVKATWRLFKYCGNLVTAHSRRQVPYCEPKKCIDGKTTGCGHFEELFWSGGEKLDSHIPHAPQGDKCR